VTEGFGKKRRDVATRSRIFLRLESLGSLPAERIFQALRERERERERDVSWIVTMTVVTLSRSRRLIKRKIKYRLSAVFLIERLNSIIRLNCGPISVSSNFSTERIPRRNRHRRGNNVRYYSARKVRRRVVQRARACYDSAWPFLNSKTT